MTTPDPSIEELLNRLRNGDETAAEECFQRFAQRLILLARTRLNSSIRQKTDPEDVVQSVFRSFFLRTTRGDYEIESWGGIWRMLVVITLRKCGHRVDYFRSERRNI